MVLVGGIGIHHPPEGSIKIDEAKPHYHKGRGRKGKKFEKLRGGGRNSEMKRNRSRL